MSEVVVTEELVFDLEPIEVAVTIGGEGYVLKEAVGLAAEKYKDAMMAGVRFSDGSMTSLKNMAGTESLLVSLCLFKDGKPVSQSTIRGWRSRIQKKLFNRAKEISDLAEEDDTEESLTKEIKNLQKKLEKLKANLAKNELESTTDGTE